MSKGLIHIYHGNGKGKTTAAMGLALRALGSGRRVGIVQFLKGSPSGEITILKKLPGITLLRGKVSPKFSFQMSDTEREETKQLHHKYLAQSIEAANKGIYDLLILDEAVGACSCGLLDREALLNFLKNKPKPLEIVLTGRGPSREMLETADYVTEMKMQKHPYAQGITARKGVEF